MNPVEDKDLSLPAAHLARRAPQEWQEFMTALRKYTDGVRDNCVQSQLDELQRSQGRAQQCVKILALLGDAVKAADRISIRKAAT